MSERGKILQTPAATEETVLVGKKAAVSAGLSVLRSLARRLPDTLWHSCPRLCCALVLRRDGGHRGSGSACPTMSPPPSSYSSGPHVHISCAGLLLSTTALLTTAYSSQQLPFCTSSSWGFLMEAT